MNKFCNSTLMLVSSIIAFSCTETTDEHKTTALSAPISVTTTTVNSITYSEEVRTTGRLVYKNEYKMSFKTAGIIEEVYVKEGQKVKSGEVLASVKLDEIEAKTSQAEIALNKAKRDYARTKSLYADSVATLEQLENAESFLKSAEHDLQAAKFNLNQSKIVAPANGIIQKILVKENEITGAGNPIIIFGAEDQGKVLIVNISDVDATKINEQDKAIINFDAWHETNFHGRIIEVEGMASPTTGTYEMKILIDDSDNKLMPGFIGTATITSSKVNQWIDLPIESLVNANSKTGTVYMVKNEIAIKQVVRFEKILNDKLLISSGLTKGDNIVVEGLGKLKGDSVAVKSNPIIHKHHD